ncbi:MULTISPECIES: hypothetical protein [Rummeliibacillus]|nr:MULTISPECIES: hypothetical protein [Rummeliibacillus]MBO2537181.1 hypothetical protein [Rummeliibacillus suwonensis]
MEENKYAKLDDEQLKELQELEEKFGYTLIAFDTGNDQGVNQDGIS